MSDGKTLTHLAFVPDDADIERDLGQTLALAETSLSQLREFRDAMDRTLYAELRAIATSLAGVRAAIGELAPATIRGAHIPAAASELKEVVIATEDATNAIMERAEAILAVDSDGPGRREEIEAHVLGIFEACAFQDITGQRLAKVRDALDAIDARVQNCMTLGAGGSARRAQETAQEARRDALILNGPAADSERPSQSDIDAMFAA
jgi:chemotaxis protein CheZ